VQECADEDEEDSCSEYSESEAGEPACNVLDPEKVKIPENVPPR